MPKIITPAMRAHLDEETTRLAAIWRITRKDGQQFFFTDHDRDIAFGGDTYRADAGFERTAIRSDAGFAVDNLDLVGVFAEGGIVENEVRASLFDGAEIALSFVNWQDPDGHGEIRLRRGTLIACFASSWTPAMVRRWHADPFGFLRPWNEVPALMGSAPPATPPSTGTGVVTFLMG
jgi:hypothetical protein